MERFSDLVGQIITKIDGSVGDETMVFHCKSGLSLMMYHEQDCCEHVRVEDICGDVDHLIGMPILHAEESVNSSEIPNDFDSGTWTFYRIATNRGQVVIRWLGTSNGYYSEKVDLLWDDKYLDI